MASSFDRSEGAIGFNKGYTDEDLTEAALEKEALSDSTEQSEIENEFLADRNGLSPINQSYQPETPSGEPVTAEFEKNSSPQQTLLLA